MNHLFNIHSSTSKGLIALVISLLLSIPSLANSSAEPLPELGDSAAGLMAPAQEQSLGQAWLRSFRASVPLESDPLVFEYIENLLFKLTSYSNIEDKNLDLVIVSNPTINAFAVPGGIIGVNTGLLLYAESEAQLASVLSHELAHLSQRHFARSVEASQRTNFTTLAGLLAGIVLAAASEGDAASAAIMASQAAALDSQLRYSRLHEKEADRLGMKTLVDAGYPAESAALMFKQMLNASRLYGKRMPEFLLTHPVTESRIADASNRARQFPTTAATPSLDYLLIKTRITALGKVPGKESAEASAKEHIKQFSLALKKLSAPEPSSPTHINVPAELARSAANYGLALSYLENRQWREARKTLAPLLKQAPHKLAYLLLDIDIDIEAGDSQRAEERLHELNATMPNNYAISMALAQTMLSNTDYKGAQKVLEALTKTRPTQADVWYLMSETHGLAGDILQLHQARAEFFLLRGNFSQARQHLKTALHFSKNNYQIAARIKERIRHVNALQKTTENL
jgi:predicted Zn-dependent protease